MLCSPLLVKYMRKLFIPEVALCRHQILSCHPLSLSLSLSLYIYIYILFHLKSNSIPMSLLLYLTKPYLIIYFNSVCHQFLLLSLSCELASEVKQSQLVTFLTDFLFSRCLKTCIISCHCISLLLHVPNSPRQFSFFYFLYALNLSS